MAEHDDRLVGAGVLVTGGGTGIGRGCAAELARRGAKVMICGRTRQTLEDSVAALGDLGLSVEMVLADVTQETEVAGAIRSTVDWAGNLHGVVANAGGGGMLAPYHLQDVGEYRRVLDLNVVGTMMCVKHSIPAMVAAGGGSFVAISSVASTTTHRVFGAYPVSKAAVDVIMRNAADEYGAAGLRFNSVQPGFVATEIMEAVPRDSSVFDSYLQNTPLGGVSDPRDIATVVAFLLGADSSRITGQAIAVDGGHNLRAGPDFRPFTGLTGDQQLARDDAG